MIHSVRYTCVLDTNVIYPIEIRDLLFWFAHYELYTPKWSYHIFDEWEDVMQRKGINVQEAKKRSAVANLAFPDALVENYESLITGLNLPDEKYSNDITLECHVSIIIILISSFITFHCRSIRVWYWVFNNNIWTASPRLLQI